MDDDILDCAREVESAIRRLARITIDRPILTPADIDLVIAHLAEAVAALPQAATQLADMLLRAQHDWHLTMDTMSDTHVPSIAIDTARLHLDAIRRPAVEIYRHLDGAHQETAHVCATDPPELQTLEPRRRSTRPEHRQPPQAATRADPASRAASGQAGAVESCCRHDRWRCIPRKLRDEVVDLSAFFAPVASSRILLRWHAAVR